MDNASSSQKSKKSELSFSLLVFGLTCRTLSPVWNESFEVMIASRVAAHFDFEINDWDRVGTATPLGKGTVDLAALEPFETSELTLPVRGENGKEQGSVSLRLMFQPESTCLGLKLCLLTDHPSHRPYTSKDKYFLPSWAGHHYDRRCSNGCQ
jgi:hypothetical protein